VCWFLYGPFCHGAIKLDISTSFTTFFFEHLFNVYYYFDNKAAANLWKHLEAGDIYLVCGFSLLLFWVSF